MKDKPKIPPASPDQLDDGLRGRITGVTRIGPRAFLAAFLVVFGMLLVILYGVTRSNKPEQTAATQTVPVASAPPSVEPHFGQNIPAFPSAPPATAPPPLILPPTPVPNVEHDQSDGSHGGSGSGPQLQAPHGPSAEEVAEQQRQAARDAAEAAERERERAALEAAQKSPILAQGVPQSGGQNVAGAAPVQVAYAPSNGSENLPGETGFAGNGSSGTASYTSYNGGGSGGGSGFAAAPGGAAGGGFRGTTAAAIDGGSTAARQNAGSSGSAPAPVPTAYLNGPFGQYQVAAPGVKLPVGARPEDFLQSQRFLYASRFELVASSVIPAELVTAIDTDEPGLVTGLVREDVYDSKTGRYLLIPKGSRLIGLYNNGIQYGQARLLVAWRRLIFPDTSSIDLLNMAGTDVNGGAGLAGSVDNHDGRLFVSALLTTVLSTGAALAGGAQSYGVLTTQTAGQAASSQAAAQISNLGTQIVQRNLGVPPTLHIPKGYPFLVLVDRDIVFPGPYREQ